MDEVDVYGTFTHEEAKRLGIASVPSFKESVKAGGESVDEKTPSHQAYVSE